MQQWKTTPKDVGDVDERNRKEIERRTGIEGIARQLVNRDWDWVHPRYRWILEFEERNEPKRNNEGNSRSVIR